MDEPVWTLSEQARIQFENRGIDSDDVFECLDTYGLQATLTENIRITVQLYELRVVLRGAVIESAMVDKNFLQAHTVPKACPPLTLHAKQRKKERKITQADIDEALKHPRQLGAIHRGKECTVVIGTTRGRGESIITVYRK